MISTRHKDRFAPRPAAWLNRCVSAPALLAIPLALGACQPTASSRDDLPGAGRKDVVHFSVSANSYIERPIFAIKLNGVEVGAGGGSVITGVAVPLGPQVVTWRLDGPEGMPGNGDTVRAINQPVLSRPSQEMRYLGVHIYPDNTVELVPEPFWPGRTERGEAFNRQWEQAHAR